jgi:hypothetical protein
MKFLRFTLLASLIITLVFISCDKGDDHPPQDPNSGNRPYIIGWWTTTNEALDYKKRFFGNDSSYIQDMSNLGFGISSGKWWWGVGDTMYVRVDSGQGTNVSPHMITIPRLTPDSLTIKWGAMLRDYYK